MCLLNSFVMSPPFGIQWQFYFFSGVSCSHFNSHLWSTRRVTYSIRSFNSYTCLLLSSRPHKQTGTGDGCTHIWLLCKSAYEPNSPIGHASFVWSHDTAVLNGLNELCLLSHTVITAITDTSVVSFIAFDRTKAHLACRNYDAHKLLFSSCLRSAVMLILIRLRATKWGPVVCGLVNSRQKRNGNEIHYYQNSE